MPRKSLSTLQEIFTLMTDPQDLWWDNNRLVEPGYQVGYRCSEKGHNLLESCTLQQNVLSAGTNDKAGGPNYVLKWSSPQTVKEAYVQTTEWKYPYMEG